MSDCWQEKGAGKHSPPGIPLQTNPNSEFSQCTHGDNSSRHFCINQPSRGKSTQVFHKWAGLDFSAFFQEELNSRIHIALESTEKKKMLLRTGQSWAILHLWALKTTDMSESTVSAQFSLGGEGTTGTGNETSPICCLPVLRCAFLCFAQFW